MLEQVRGLSVDLKRVFLIQQVWIEPLTAHSMIVLQTTTSWPADLGVSKLVQAGARYAVMRYKRAVEKLRILAETCERVKMFWFDTEPFLKAVYAFGEVADGADPLDAVQVAVAINLSPEEVPWESSPEGTDWLANELRLSKGGFLYFWRSYLDPIWNHYIRGPVRIWSVDGGPDEQALTALEARDFGSLKRLIPEPADGRLQLREDLGAALAHLREVRDKYWDHGWRRGQRGSGRYPENELWDAVEGYLDLLDASRSSDPDA